MTGSRILYSHLTALAATLLTLSGAPGRPLRIVYNASASAPLGWYAVQTARQIAPGDLVVVRPPSGVERLMIERRYIGVGVPLLKFVLAIRGAQVCRAGDRVTVNAAVVGAAFDHDSRGRPLPRWSGCRRLGPNEILSLDR